MPASAAATSTLIKVAATAACMASPRLSDRAANSGSTLWSGLPAQQRNDPVHTTSLSLFLAALQVHVLNGHSYGLVGCQNCSPNNACAAFCTECSM